MTDQPILFSAPMVRAILSGAKTQTRRVLKPQPQEDLGLWLAERDMKAARWAPGDRLWVREGFALVGATDPGFLLYRASGYEAECDRHGFDKPYPSETVVRWRSSIHMPRWASRITLAVEAVRVERLHEISEADAVAEGCGVFTSQTAIHHSFSPDDKNLFVPSFRELWASIHGPDAWNSNPWVSVTTFRRVGA